MRFAPQHSVGLRTPPRPPGAAQLSLPRPKRMKEKGLIVVLAGGRARGGVCSGGEAAGPGARLSERSTPRCADTPSPSLLPLAPLRRRKPAPPPQPHPGPLRFPPTPVLKPRASQEASRATRQAANWGGPLGGQPPGIGQLPAAPAPARLLFVRAAPISLGFHSKAGSLVAHSRAR